MPTTSLLPVAYSSLKVTNNEELNALSGTILRGVCARIYKAPADSLYALSHYRLELTSEHNVAPLAVFVSLRK